MQRLKDLIYDLRHRTSGDPKERIKLIVACSLLAICGCWLLYLLVSNMERSAPRMIPQTPGVRIAQELNAKMLERTEFADVNFVVTSESPLRFEVIGLVHSEETLTRLKAYLAELRPEQDYDLQVAVSP